LEKVAIKDKDGDDCRCSSGGVVAAKLVMERSTTAVVV
jgi:hypothetical protein